MSGNGDKVLKQDLLMGEGCDVGLGDLIEIKVKSFRLVTEGVLILDPVREDIVKFKIGKKTIPQVNVVIAFVRSGAFFSHWLFSFSLVWVLAYIIVCVINKQGAFGVFWLWGMIYQDEVVSVSVACANIMCIVLYMVKCFVFYTVMCILSWWHTRSGKKP